MRKTITIEIDAEGKATVDLVGFHGKGCAKVLDDFAPREARLMERNKAEYYAAELQKQRQKAGHDG